MAAIVHKPNALLKNDNRNFPPRKRSESRLKRYVSVTDSRIWAQHAFQKKSCMIDMISKESTKKGKKIGQILPVDEVYNILLKEKNEFIINLETKLKCLIKLLHGIDLSNLQLQKIKSLCSVNFKCLNEVLADILSLRSEDNVEKHIQVKPRTFSRISEMVVQTSSISTFTPVRARGDKASITNFIRKQDKSITTTRQEICHVSLQVVLARLETFDKCTSTIILPSQSLLSIHTFPSIVILADNINNVKSYSESSVTKSNDFLNSSHKSSMTLSVASTNDSFRTCSLAPSMTSLRESNKPYFDASRIIETIILEDSPSFGNETIQVKSHSEQASFTPTKRKTSSVVQLYKASKLSSIESTDIKNNSELNINPQSYTANTGSKIDTAISASENSKKVQMVDHSCSTSDTLELANSSLDTETEEAEDDDIFEDCGLEFLGMDVDLEICSNATKLSDSKLEQQKLFVKRAIWQLDLIKQTVLDNANIISKINIRNVLENIKKSKHVNRDVENLEKQLGALCLQGDRNSCEILMEQLDVLQQYYKCIINEDIQEEEKNSKSVQVICSNYMLTTSHEIIADIASSSEISEKKRHLQQIDYYKSKLVNLDLLNLETKMLKETIVKLENELKVYDDIKAEFITMDSSSLEDGLVAIETIQTQIWELKRKAALCDELEKHLEGERHNVINLKHDLATLSAQKYNDYEALKYRAHEAEIISLERDRLKVQLNELQKLQTENINLRNKCAELECGRSRMQIETVAINDDLKFVRQQAVEIEKLQTEKSVLLKAIVSKECEIVDQEEQIERLIIHVDRLTLNKELQQEKSRKLVAQLRTDIEAKQKYIDRMDNDLEWVEEKLKHSISVLSKDSSEYQLKLSKLEGCCSKYKTKIDSMKDTIQNLQKQLDYQQELNHNYLVELKQKNALLQEANISGEGNYYDYKMKNVTRMENILKKSHNAVRKVIDELAKQYGCDLHGIKNVVPDFMNNT